MGAARGFSCHHADAARTCSRAASVNLTLNGCEARPATPLRAGARKDSTGASAASVCQASLVASRFRSALSRLLVRPFAGPAICAMGWACGAKTGLDFAGDTLLQGGSDGGADGSSEIPSCLGPSPSPAPDPCTPCVEAGCSAQLGILGAQCGAYATCLCPGGTFLAGAASTLLCEQQVLPSSCMSLLDALVTCEVQQCGMSCDFRPGVRSACQSTSCGASGQTVTFCDDAAGQCSYQVDGQTFACNSCSDVAACSQEAVASCP